MDEKTAQYFEVHNLKVNYPDYLLEVASLQIKRNDWVLIEAPSGFGKTTLLRAIAGFESAAGEIFLDSKRIDQLPVHEREIGFVFQDHLLFSHMNAIENVMVGLKLRGMKDEQARPIAQGLIKRLELEKRQNAPIQELSGGERQRVAVLRSLIWKPKLLLLDEPFKGLDPTQVKLMSDFIRQFVAEHGIPVLCVSHQQDGGQVQATLRLVGEKHHDTRTFHRK